MSTARRSRVIAALLLVTAGVSGCGGGSLSTAPPSLPTDPPTSTGAPSSPATASPSPTVRASTADDVALEGLDACSLLTSDARAGSGLGPAAASTPASGSRAVSVCSADAPDGASFTVATYPTTSLETWRADFPVATSTTVAGFPAATELTAPEGGRAVCQYAIGTAPSATLEVGVYVPSAVVADHDVCGETATLAGAVVTALRATR